MRQVHKKDQAGFSLIELLVVSTIMIVLMTIGIVSYQSSSRNSRNAKRKADLETVRQALVLYRNDNSTYPDTASDGTNAAYLEMLTTISDYISFGSLADPKDEDPYQYTYSSDGPTFSLCSNLEGESGSTAYCLSNP